MQNMSFSSLGLSNELMLTLEKLEFNQATPIQIEAIPPILEGKDVLGIAKTGSGKTASYVLPILSTLHKKPSTENRHPGVLLLVPTRELAQQVEEVFKDFTIGIAVKPKVMAVYGGVSINPQMIGLNNVSILIATPGRLIELVESKAVHLSQVHTLVLDEADKLLNLGFKEEIDKIFQFLPKKRQNLLFSATLNSDVEAINQLILKSPVVVSIASEEDSVELIQQSAYSVEDEQKGPFLRYLIKSKEMTQVLVFTSSTFKADAVADKLRKNGIEAAAIHSKKSQGARNQALKRFKEGNLKVLVATDLLARGIDIEFLPVVINYELPRSPKDYIHRIGRTGRAEQSGDAIALVSKEEEHHFKVIQKKMKTRVELISQDIWEKEMKSESTKK